MVLASVCSRSVHAFARDNVLDDAQISLKGNDEFKPLGDRVIGGIEAAALDSRVSTKQFVARWSQARWRVLQRQYSRPEGWLAYHRPA